MRILLTSENFDGFGGTETYIVAVATELARLGHEVSVYSPHRGAVADHLRASGIPVSARDQQPRGCDLVLANDAATAAEMAADQPDAVRLFVAHSAQYLLQAPPLLTGTVQAVVVLNDRVARTVRARSAHAPIWRLRQPVDLLRFWNLGPVRATPRIALVNSNYVVGVRAQMLQRACRDAGLDLQWINQSHPHAAPEVLIAGADIVIGLGRSALEGMAAGRPVIVHGVPGADGWVTPERYPAMESDGFAGLARPEASFDVAALTAELRSFDPELGEVGRDLATAHHSVQEHVPALLAIAAEGGAGPGAPTDALPEIAHLVRMQWAADGAVHGARAEAARLRAVVDDALAQVDRLRGDVGRLEQEATALREELAVSREREGALRAMRRVRVALEAGAQLDRARAWADRRQDR